MGWGRVNHDKQLPFQFDKKQFKIYFYIGYDEKVCNISKSPIETYRKYTFCVHMHNLHPGANLPPGANKFAPPRKKEQICKFAPGCEFLKHRTHGQKFTRGANLHTGANCAYEPCFRELRMEDNSSFFNYMKMESLMFDEILNRVCHRIQENDTHFRKALEPGLVLELIMRSWRERDKIFVSAAQSPIA